MKQTYLVVAIAGILLLTLAGYLFIRSNNANTNNLPATSANQPKLNVVASFYPLYFFTKEISGDKADVYNLTPAGAEPHEYEPTARDIARVEDSDLLVLNGVQLEGWANKIKDTLKNTTVITVSDDLANLLTEEDGETVADPHLWLSPVLAKLISAKIAAALSQIDPDNAGHYANNLQILNQKLDGLNQKFARGLSNCQKNDIITSHAAFGYLAAAYQLKQVSISGLSTEEEPSPAQLAAVADFAKKNQVKYIFFESLASPKLSDTIAREVGAQTLVLNPLEGLTPEDLTNGKNYFTEMENNLTNLTIALQCQ